MCVCVCVCVCVCLSLSLSLSLSVMERYCRGPRTHDVCVCVGWGGGVVRRDGGGGVCETMNPTLHCHHQNDVCLKLANNESHFNVSAMCVYVWKG